MALKDYKVTYEDGTETFFQFDTSEESGKAQLEALKESAKNDDSMVKSVAEGSPPKTSSPDLQKAGGG